MEYSKIMNHIEYLVAAYSFIWLILAFYFYNTGRKLKKLEEKAAFLESEKERE